LALFAQGAVLAPQAAKLLAFGGGKPIAAPSLIAIRLGHPVANRLRGGLELAGEFLRVASRPHQFHHPPPILRRVPFVRVSHRGFSSTCPNRLLSTKPGQLQSGIKEAKRKAQNKRIADPTEAGYRPKTMRR